MKQLELSVAADADLFDILAYGTASFGEAASDSYYLGLCDAFALDSINLSARSPSRDFDGNRYLLDDRGA